MDILYTSSTDGCLKFDNNLQITMDYDSGYMSHNPDSILDSSLESSNYNNYTTRKQPEKPIYLSEDALLETPIVRKDIQTNISLAIEEEDYEETRELFNTLGSDIEIPSSCSVSSQENGLSGFNSSESDVSVVISPAKPIIFDNRWQTAMNLTIFDEVKNIKSFSSSETTSSVENSPSKNKSCSVPIESIMKMSILSTNNPEKKLPVITSKANENTNSVQQLPVSDNVAISSLELGFQSLPEIKVSPDASINDEPYKTCNDSSRTLVVKDEYQQNSVVEDLTVKVGLSPQGSEKTEIGILTSNKNSIVCEFSPSSFALKEEEPLPYPSSSVVSPKLSSRSEVTIQTKPSLTPKKTYVNSVNPDVSPDLFSDDETSPASTRISSKSVNYIAKEQYVLTKDKRILRRTQNSLKGVLPPRSVTVLQLPVNEMLNQLENNKKLFWYSNSIDCEKKNEEEISGGESSMVGESKSLLVNGTMEEAKRMKFPEILKQRNLGLYHNRSKLSEEFEELCVKFAERYVGAETQSTCTVFEANCSSSSSPRKRGIGGANGSSKLRWTAKSPGRRLSHLARRRITFSSANLQAGGGLSNVGGGGAGGGSRARQILVDAKKIDVLNIRRSPRKTLTKTPNKSPRKRTRTPSSSAKKKLALRFRSLAGEIQSSGGSSSQSNTSMSHLKRTLFTSPDKNNTKASFLSTTFSQPSSTFESESFSVNKKPAKRALFNSPQKKSPFKNVVGANRSPFKRLDIPCERKRKRDDDLNQTTQSQQPSKIQRSISMDVVKSTTANKAHGSSQQSSLCRTKSDGILSSVKPPPLQELSAAHKKKLQWAVYEALRAHNVTPGHAQFKVYASVLARVVRRLMHHLLNGSSGSSAAAGAPPLVGGSTTERMLRFAKRHSLAVIKGASVEEVIGEYTRMRLKMQKPHGYISIEEFNSMKDKENQIRDPPRTLESLEKRKLEELQKPRIVGDSRIERIRKVINFGDDIR